MVSVNISKGERKGMRVTGMLMRKRAVEPLLQALRESMYELRQAHQGAMVELTELPEPLRDSNGRAHEYGAQIALGALRPTGVCLIVQAARGEVGTRATRG